MYAWWSTLCIWDVFPHKWQESEKPGRTEHCPTVKREGERHRPRAHSWPLSDIKVDKCVEGEELPNSETGKRRAARYRPRAHLSDINVDNSGMLE